MWRWIMRFGTTFLALFIILGLVTIFVSERLRYLNFTDSIPDKLTVDEQDATRGVVYVIALDMDRNKKVDANTIKQGLDSVVVIKSDSKLLPEKSRKSDGGIYIFNGVTSILKYDSNNDHVINLADPVFNDIQLLTRRRFDPKGIVKPITETGIRGLYFDKKTVEESQKRTENNATVDKAKKDNNKADAANNEVAEPPEDEIVGYALMSDSTRREMHRIAIPLRALGDL